MRARSLVKELFELPPRRDAWLLGRDSVHDCSVGHCDSCFLFERQAVMLRLKEANLVLETHMRELGIAFVAEYKFCGGRAWRFDYVLRPRGSSDFSVGVEIEGGVGYFKNPKGQVIRGGRHSREDGYRSDLEKYRTASALGFKLFRFSTIEVLDGTAKDFLEKWL